MPASALPAPLPDPLPIRPRGRLDARVRPPGSRSLTNRALLAAALARGESVLAGATRERRRAAHARGRCARSACRSACDGERWTVTGCARAPARARPRGRRRSRLGHDRALPHGAATPRATGAEVVLDGVARMRERPIGDLAAALRALGADVETLGARRLPARARARRRPRAAARRRSTRGARASTCRRVLLAAPYAARDVALALADGELVSRPYVDLTLQVMRAFGADADWTADGGLRVRAARLRGPPLRDRARRLRRRPTLRAAAIAGGRVRVEGIGPRLAPARPPHPRGVRAHGLPRAARSGRDRARRGGRRAGRRRRATTNRCPTPCWRSRWSRCSRRGRREIRNVANLRIKETDRLAALETEMRSLGGRADAGPDWLAIEPGPSPAPRSRPTTDHRMAMSFALAGLAVPGVSIRDPGCVAKTWPGFFAALETW